LKIFFLGAKPKGNHAGSFMPNAAVIDLAQPQHSGTKI
jgi:hypothetical protein